MSSSENHGKGKSPLSSWTLVQERLPPIIISSSDTDLSPPRVGYLDETLSESAGPGFALSGLERPEYDSINEKTEFYKIRRRRRGYNFPQFPKNFQDWGDSNDRQDEVPTSDNPPTIPSADAKDWGDSNDGQDEVPTSDNPPTSPSAGAMAHTPHFLEHNLHRPSQLSICELDSPLVWEDSNDWQNEAPTSDNYLSDNYRGDSNDRQDEVPTSDNPLIEKEKKKRKLSAKFHQFTHSAEVPPSPGDSPASATITSKIGIKEVATSSQSEEDESMSESSSNPGDTLDEFIISPRRYQDRLTALLENATHNSSLFTFSKLRTRLGLEVALNHFTGQHLREVSPFTSPRGQRVSALSRCRDVLQKVCENINRMKTCGFCSGFISILVMSFDRKDVVHLNHLDTAVIRDLFDLSRSCFLEVKKDSTKLELSDLEQKIREGFEHVLKQLGLKDLGFLHGPFTSSEWNRVVIAMANLIDIIVLLYCSAHLERFDQKYLQMSLEGLKIHFGRPEIQYIVFKRRSLACLDNYLGHQQVWVLQLLRGLELDHFLGIDEKNTRLSVSAHIEDLADIWGPLLPVKIDGFPGIVAFQAGAGVLVPWPNGTAAREDDERYYHWTEDLDELGENLTESAYPAFLPDSHKKQRLLIGEDNSRILAKRKLNLPADISSQGKSNEQQVRLKIKPSCYFNSHKITEKLKGVHCVRMLGTERPRIYQDSETISGTIGYIATLTGASTLKRSAGFTVKDNIVSTWMPNNCNRNPKILECWYGLEVSACSGNARRQRLKDILNSSAMRKHLDLCYPNWITTDHGIGFSKALADQNKRAFRWLWNDNPEWRSELQKLVYSCFDALRHTRVDENNQLSAFWMSDSDRQIVDVPAGLSSWTGVLKDTECSCTMAVLSTSCLGNTKPFSRLNPISDCRKENSNGYTLLETALVINRKAHLPKRLSYSKDCECGSKRCWDTHKLETGDDLSLGQLGKVVVRESSDNHAQILACWEKGVGTEIRRARDVARVNILKESPMPHHWEVMDSNDERRRPRPVQLFLMSHATKKFGEWKAFS